MPYDKQTWADGEAGGTPLSAAPLNHMEDGIAAAQSAAEAAAEAAATATTGLASKADTAALAAKADASAVAAKADTTAVNAAVAGAKDRSSHTGTQLSSTISDFTEAVQDVVGAEIVAGANVTVSYDDGTGKVTIGATTGTGGTTTSPRLGVLRVAGIEAPADVKAQADYVCTGIDDQTVINQALLAASRPGDGFGGSGGGCVELVGPNFYTGQNGGVITMYPATWLRGSGYGTLLRPMFSSFSDQGAIELLNTSTDHVRVSDLTIGRPSDQTINCHGIKFNQIADGSIYDFNTGNDPFLRIHDIFVLNPAGHGVYLTGTGGGARETHVDHVLAWNPGLSGFAISGSSDVKLTSCTVNGGAGGPGYSIGGGNAKLVNCKVYYTDGAYDGYLVSSGRAEIVGCAAQDNARWGFNVSGGDCTLVGCVADSNARLDATGGGFQIGSSGTYADLHAFDRGQTPGSPQLRGILFSGSPQVFLTGRVKVPSGSAHIVGSPGTNSYARVVRDGTTSYMVPPEVSASASAPASPTTGQVWVDLGA